FEESVIFDPTLARGLDYYNGLILKVQYNDRSIISSSISAGGRYDDLLSRLSNNRFGKIPAIGLSIVIERIVVILKNQRQLETIKPATVYVGAVGKNMLDEMVKMCLPLRL